MNDSTRLHFAAYYNRLSVVKFLVGNARATINACCDNAAFSTPLAWAKYAGNYEVVEYLTAAGGLETPQ
jgi:ankyrin repeat protein